MSAGLACAWCVLLAVQPAPTPAAVVSPAPQIQRHAIQQEARTAPASAPDRTAARAALRAVLAQRAFAQARATSWQADLRRRIERWLSDAWDRTLGRHVGQQTLARLLAWGVTFAAVVVLLVWLTQLTVRKRAEQPIALGRIPPRRVPGGELALEAAALVRAGRAREAARVAYRAAVQRLEEEGAFKVDDTRTPREYLRLLPAPHRRRAGLSALTAAFERLWYGSRAASADDGRAILALLQDLECLPRDPAN